MIVEVTNANARDHSASSSFSRVAAILAKKFFSHLPVPGHIRIVGRVKNGTRKRRKVRTRNTLLRELLKGLLQPA